MLSVNLEKQAKVNIGLEQELSYESRTVAVDMCEEKLVTSDEVIHFQLFFPYIITAQITQSGQGLQKSLCKNNYT
jgi:hypothetical protein